ncbi:hypothetical protein LCGC14_0480780 [marine sediment metagenome]|uniref:Uncharacterized protein n=1 Tax=marine sediment metagenome TaxID=412755 RepID=A0A0F9SEK8_9ZZZZ
MGRNTVYCQTREQYGYLSDDFSRDYAMRLFHLSEPALEELVGRYVRGKRAGKLKGKLLWEKVTVGGWKKHGPGYMNGAVVAPGTLLSYSIVDSWTGTVLVQGLQRY